MPNSDIYIIKLTQKKGSYVLHGLYIPHGAAAWPFTFRTSYGTHLLYHLPINGSGLAGSQVAVAAALQIDANLLGDLHLEAVYG